MSDAPDPSRISAAFEQAIKWGGTALAILLGVLRVRKAAMRSSAERTEDPPAGRVDTARFEAASVELKLALAEADMRGAAARIRQLEEEVRKVRVCAARVDELQRQLRDSEATMRLAVARKDSRIRELEEQLADARRQLRLALAATDELVAGGSNYSEIPNSSPRRPS